MLCFFDLALKTGADVGGAMFHLVHPLMPRTRLRCVKGGADSSGSEVARFSRSWLLVVGETWVLLPNIGER